MNDDSNFDQTESVGGTMIRLNLREWELPPELEHLRSAPMADFETCDTVSEEYVALERLYSRGPRKKFLKTSFASAEKLNEYLAKNEFIFFHVFNHEPGDHVLKLLAQHSERERLFLFDAAQDAGFLRSVPVPRGQTESASLVDLRGIGAWANGALIGIEERVEEMAAFMERARKAAGVRK
jgi:hypothetical protein